MNPSGVKFDIGKITILENAIIDIDVINHKVFGEIDAVELTTVKGDILDRDQTGWILIDLNITIVIIVCTTYKGCGFDHLYLGG